MGVLGVDNFIRLGVRYANRLGRLLCDSMLTLGRLGDAPVYGIYQKMHDALRCEMNIRSPVERVRREAAMQSSTSCDATLVILQVHDALVHSE